MDAEVFMEATGGRLEKVRQLLDAGANIRSTNYEGRTPLHAAASAGHEAIVHLLLERGAEVDAKDRDNNTPLHLAVLQDRERIIRVLLDRGADVNARSTTGKTPLHIAVWKGIDDVVRLLLDRGANMEAKDIYGRTPLHIATDDEYPPNSVIRLLVRRGANINAFDNSGQTPLHWLSYRDNLPVARLLVELGANIQAKEEDGQSAYDIARPKVRAFFDEVLAQRGRATARAVTPFLSQRLPGVVQALEAERRGVPPGDVPRSTTLPAGLGPEMTRNILGYIATPTPGAVRSLREEADAREARRRAEAAGAGAGVGGKRRKTQRNPKKNKVKYNNVVRKTYRSVRRHYRRRK